MRHLFRGVFIFLIFNCAREHKSISEQEIFAKEWIENTIKASDPNTLDKVIYSIRQADGSYITQINATHTDFHVYFSFSQNVQIPASRSAETGWDIAFNRYKISTNSGKTNELGKGGACQSIFSSLKEVALSKLSTHGCADNQFTIDSVVSGQGVGGTGVEFVGNSLLSNWYNYTIGNLTSKNLVYIIRSGGDSNKYFALVVLGYYSSAGTSGYPSFQWKSISD